MSGSKYVLDTNTVLYLLGGRIRVGDIPAGDYCISFITELELLVYPKLSPIEHAVIQAYLNTVPVFDINGEIKRATVALSREHRLKLPDAIICATAQCIRARVLTFDKRLARVGLVTVL